MSAAASTDDAVEGATPLERRAARGELPDWARLSEEREAHVVRVATLMGEWARVLSLPADEVIRWEAAAWLHDALRDAHPIELREVLPPHEQDLPDALLHGPAAAACLEGLVDPRVARAVRYHTTGHPSLGTLGRALYAADFLDPGRDFAARWRSDLRARMPHDLDRVLREIVAGRLHHLREIGAPIRPESEAFHASLEVEDA